MLNTTYFFTFENAGATTISEHTVMWPKFKMIFT